MQGFDYEQAAKDGITTIVEIVYDEEWTSDIIEDLHPTKTEVLIETGSFKIYRLHCKVFADREELRLLRAVTEHTIVAFKSIGL